MSTNPAIALGRRALWAPLTVVVAHWAFGGWFGHEPVVDPIAHFSGGLAIAFVVWTATRVGARYLGDLTPLTVAALCVGLATVAAVGWEFAEFLVDSTGRSNLQGGLGDTMRDLFLGMCGALCFVIAERLVRRRAGGREP